jgi:hypothetical protein
MHGVHVITGKCRALPVGAFVEGELNLAMDAIFSYSFPFIINFIFFYLFLLYYKGIVEGHYIVLMNRAESVIHKKFHGNEKVGS